MKWIVTGCLLVLLLNCSSSDSADLANYKLRYDFTSPSTRLTLPAILNEISGQTIIDDSTIACVQDEQGIIFLYDTQKNKIRQQITFAGDGDYEGICKVGADIFVLRSDGVIFQVTNFASATPGTETFSTGIPADNNEGLCYDSLHNCLLIAAKGRISDDKSDKDLRGIYSFDLATKKLSAEPVFEFDVNELVDFAYLHDVNIPTKEKKKGVAPALKFRISAIGIHPLTRELYVLSATDHALFIFESQPVETGHGEALHIEMLDEKIFNKAEGISFYNNGDLLITNEAQDKKPTLMRFNYITTP